MSKEKSGISFVGPRVERSGDKTQSFCLQKYPFCFVQMQGVLFLT